MRSLSIGLNSTTKQQKYKTFKVNTAADKTELQWKAGLWEQEGPATESSHVWGNLRVNVDIMIIADSNWSAQRKTVRIKGKGQKFKTGKQHNRGSKKTPWSLWGLIIPGAWGVMLSLWITEWWPLGGTRLISVKEVEGYIHWVFCGHRGVSSSWNINFRIPKICGQHDKKCYSKCPSFHALPPQ